MFKDFHITQHNKMKKKKIIYTWKSILKKIIWYVNKTNNDRGFWVLKISAPFTEYQYEKVIWVSNLRTSNSEVAMGKTWKNQVETSRFVTCWWPWQRWVTVGSKFKFWNSCNVGENFLHQSKLCCTTLSSLGFREAWWIS